MSAKYTKDELDRISRQNFHVFAERALRILIPDFEHFPYIELICAYLGAMINGQLQRLVLNLPPRHGKSILGIIFVAYYLGRYPDRKVIVVSHSEGLAKELALMTVDLMNTDLYRSIWSTRIRPDVSAAMDFQTTAGGGRLGAGISTSVTGRGADLLFLDDPISAQNAYSADYREAAVRSYRSMLAPRLNNPTTGQTLMIGQRLHPLDLAGHLIEMGFPCLKLAFEAEQHEAIDFAGTSFRRSAGEILQPGRLTSDLKREHAPYDWAAQYQQQPTSTFEAMVKSDDLQLVDATPTGGESIVSWDTANLKTGSSFTAGLVFRRVGDASYLEHIECRQLAYEELVPLALGVHDRFHPAVTLIEQVGTGISLATELRKAGANVVEVPAPRQSKLERLSAQLHHLRRASVKIKRGIPGVANFIEEVTTFPNGPRNDQVDALSQYLAWVTDHSEAVQKKVLLKVGEAQGQRHDFTTKKGVVTAMLDAAGATRRMPAHAWRPHGPFRRP